jgi:hypothetical protein
MSQSAPYWQPAMPGLAGVGSRLSTEEERMSWDEGRTRPLTVITPIKPGRTTQQRIIFEVLPRTPFGRSDKLLQLSFIQSARWSLITGLPYNGAQQEPERLRYDYLLFESNFNGPLDAYIEAFARVVPERMEQIWNSSFGFPKPRPVQPFLRYIQSNDFGADHFYSAYPNASNTEVLTGLRTQGLVTALSRHGRSGTPQEFRRRYDDLLSEAQRRPAPLTPQVPARGNTCGDKYAFTALTPVPAHQEETLRKMLRSLPTETGSPFADVPGLHFARWALIGDVVYQGHPQRRDSWRNAYLLTTTTTDGATDPLRDLYMKLRPEADEVLGFCIGYPGRQDEAAFVRYFTRNQVRTNRFFCGYPDASLDAVLTGIDTHQWLMAFAHRHQRDDAPTLQAAFFDELPGGRR